MNILNLVIDRLHVGYLGCYGNSWIATPHFDRLAADGFVFDQALIESPDLARQYAAFTAGRGRNTDESSLVAQLREAGLATALITDDPDVADFPWAATIDEILRVEVERVPRTAQEIEQTNLARLFAVAGQWLEGAREPFCLWLHCGSLGMSWDAPLELRERYAEEDEPRPTDDAIVPARLLPDDYDPDELLPISQAYAGQVTLLDLCLGTIVEELRQSSFADRTLVSLVSARGLPLGEHRRVGPLDDALHSELVHVPWILRLPDEKGAAARSQALVQSADWGATLLDVVGASLDESSRAGHSVLPLVRGEVETVRDRLFLFGAGDERAVRTGGWYLRTPRYALSDGGKHRDIPVELYAKPDDRWEMNDVASRCPEVVELLTVVLDEGQNPDAGASPLADALAAGID